MQSDVGTRIQTNNIRPRSEESAKYMMFIVVQNTLDASPLWLEHRNTNHQGNPESNPIAAISKLGRLSIPPR